MSQVDVDTDAERADRLERFRLRATIAWAIIGLGIIVFAVYKLCGSFMPVISIILLTMFFTFVLRRPVDWFERHHINRTLGSTLSILIALIIVAAVCAVIFVPIFNEIRAFFGALPGYIDSLGAFIDSVTDPDPAGGQSVLSPEVRSVIQGAISTVSDWVAENAPAAAETLVTGVTSTISGIVTVIMSLVATFWVLRDLPKLNREVKIIAGEKYSLRAEVARAIAVRVFGGYIRGLIIASCCTGVIAAIGYSIIGVPYAWLLGLLTGLLNVIPYFGPWIGGILGGLAGLTVSPWVGLGALLVAIIAQEFTDIFITPRVYGTAVELHPAVVIVALAAGGVIGGVLGMILAVPAAAAIKAVYIYWFESKTGRQLVSKNGALFKGKPGGSFTEPDPAFDATGGSVRPVDFDQFMLDEILAEAEAKGQGRIELDADEVPEEELWE